MTVQNDSVAPTAAYPLVMRTLLTAVNWLGREADHPLPPGAEARNAYRYTENARATLAKWNKRAKWKLHPTQRTLCHIAQHNIL